MLLPSPFVEPERYKGRPLLIILENYVLDCIGELPPQKQESIRQAVQKVFGGDNDWKKTVRNQLKLEQSLDDHIREMWIKNQEIAKANRMDIHPVQFAKMVVDQNFADLIGPPLE